MSIMDELAGISCPRTCGAKMLFLFVLMEFFCDSLSSQLCAEFLFPSIIENFELLVLKNVFL